MFEPKKPKKAIMSISGKGGVGKTLVASNVAISLSKKYKVGLLDADIKSPNIAAVLGIKATEFKHADNSFRKIIPIEYNGLKVFSTATMFPDYHGITIPGEQQRNFLRQAVYDVEWGKLDYLIVDMDPSSGDSLLCMREIFRDLQAIVVSTSDVSSLSDCNRIIHACIIHNIPIVGVIGNMVSSECPFCYEIIICKNCDTVISFGDEQKIKDVAEKFHVPYLGGIHFNPEIKMRNNGGNPLLPDMKIVDEVIRRLL
jgi:Mrp family chromosome partitioning ATPase